VLTECSCIVHLHCTGPLVLYRKTFVRVRSIFVKKFLKFSTAFTVTQCTRMPRVVTKLERSDLVWLIRGHVQLVEGLIT